ncbi:MAG: PEPxxWA-CTERM sorting domain-containing protein [Phenylobacterium sp.]|nr:PEPxxWA-CTERM sorting domain-containing protein [Phenylobacterium sp.]MDP3747530.1 PEPxxWA-CTERM sorting domain-containing protein [Phenylobacterium sp.]
MFAAATTLGASAANAAVTIHSFDSYQSALNANESLVTDFNAPLTLAAGWTLGGDASLLTGTSGLGAAPAFGPLDPGDDDPTRYLSVQAGQVATFTAPNVSRVSLYIGSLDDYNSITFYLKGGGTQVITGLQLGAISGANDGDRQQADTNGRFTFYSTENIVGFDLNSTTNSFEVSNIGAAVPEPATWAMMIIGFGGVGGMLRSARRKQAVAFA